MQAVCPRNRYLSHPQGGPVAPGFECLNKSECWLGQDMIGCMGANRMNVQMQSAATRKSCISRNSICSLQPPCPPAHLPTCRRGPLKQLPLKFLKSEMWLSSTRSGHMVRQTLMLCCHGTLSTSDDRHLCRSSQIIQEHGHASSIWPKSITSNDEDSRVNAAQGDGMQAALHEPPLGLKLG